MACRCCSAAELQNIRLLVNSGLFAQRRDTGDLLVGRLGRYIFRVYSSPKSDQAAENHQWLLNTWLLLQPLEGGECQRLRVGFEAILHCQAQESGTNVIFSLRPSGADALQRLARCGEPQTRRVRWLDGQLI